MTRFVAFLRGVYVGGVNLKMAEVAAAFEDAGFTAVKTSSPAATSCSTAYPFEREVEGHHSYVTFVTDEQVLDELAAPAADGPAEEKIQRGEGVVYWQVPRSGTLATTIGKTMGKKRYKSSTTTRNLRTLDKVLRSVHSAR